MTDIRKEMETCKFSFCLFTAAASDSDTVANIYRKLNSHGSSELHKINNTRISRNRLYLHSHNKIPVYDLILRQSHSVSLSQPLPLWYHHRILLPASTVSATTWEQLNRFLLHLVLRGFATIHQNILIVNFILLSPCVFPHYSVYQQMHTRKPLLQFY
jgi:hypothetical protein